MTELREMAREAAERVDNEAAWGGNECYGINHDLATDIILAALLRAKEAGAMEERGKTWQPIKTCPCVPNATYIGYDERGNYFIFYASRQPDGEMRYYLDEPDGYYRRSPRFWMPLHEPPVAAIRQDTGR